MVSHMLHVGHVVKTTRRVYYTLRETWSTQTRNKISFNCVMLPRVSTRVTVKL